MHGHPNPATYQGWPGRHVAHLYGVDIAQFVNGHRGDRDHRSGRRCLLRQPPIRAGQARLERRRIQLDRNDGGRLDRRRRQRPRKPAGCDPLRRPTSRSSERTSTSSARPTPRVTIIEYASMTCPHCANFHEQTMPRIKSEFIDKGLVRFVFRPFPLDGLAARASLLAQCAPGEGYFSMIDVLFRSQSEWASAPDPLAALKQIGRTAGISDADVDRCIAIRRRSTASSPASRRRRPSSASTRRRPSSSTARNTRTCRSTIFRRMARPSPASARSSKTCCRSPERCIRANPGVNFALVQFTKLRLTGFKSFVDPTELADRARPDRHRRPQRLRQVQPRRGAALGDGRDLGQVDARRRDGRRHLRRQRRRGRRATSPRSCWCSTTPTARCRPTFNDHDELEISRRIERGGGSAYSVNGQEVRARDVQLLFADAATGAHSTALVSQGRIGALINAKPTDRRGAARGGRRHHRPAFAPARGRAAPARGRGQSRAARRRHRHARKPAPGAEEAGPPGGALSQPRRSASAAPRRCCCICTGARRPCALAGRRARVRRRRDAGRRDARAKPLRRPPGRPIAADGLPPLRQAEAEAAAELQRLTIARAEPGSKRSSASPQRGRGRAPAGADRDRPTRETALAERCAGGRCAPGGRAATRSRARGGIGERAAAEATAAVAEAQARSTPRESELAELTRPDRGGRGPGGGRAPPPRRARRPHRPGCASGPRRSRPSAPACSRRSPTTARWRAARDDAGDATGRVRAAAGATAPPKPSRRGRRGDAAEAAARARLQDGAGRARRRRRGGHGPGGAARRQSIGPVAAADRQRSRSTPGYEAALGAALGDDLDGVRRRRRARALARRLPPLRRARRRCPTAPSRWRRSCAGPALLARRLAQIGVVAGEAAGRALCASLAAGPAAGHPRRRDVALGRLHDRGRRADRGGRRACASATASTELHPRARRGASRPERGRGRLRRGAPQRRARRLGGASGECARRLPGRLSRTADPGARRAGGRNAPCLAPPARGGSPPWIEAAAAAMAPTSRRPRPSWRPHAADEAALPALAPISRAARPRRAQRCWPRSAAELDRMPQRRRAAAARSRGPRRPRRAAIERRAPLLAASASRRRERQLALLAERRDGGRAPRSRSSPRARPRSPTQRQALMDADRDGRRPSGARPPTAWPRRRRQLAAADRGLKAAETRLAEAREDRVRAEAAVAQASEAGNDARRSASANGSNARRKSALGSPSSMPERGAARAASRSRAACSACCASARIWARSTCAPRPRRPRSSSRSPACRPSAPTWSAPSPGCARASPASTARGASGCWPPSSWSTSTSRSCSRGSSAAATRI